MLNTAELLAAGLGAQLKATKGNDGKTNSAVSSSPSILNVKPGGDNVGNAHLRLWIGERALGSFRLVFLLLLFLSVACCLSVF